MPKTGDYSNQRSKVSPPSLGLADLRKSHRLTQAQVADQVAAILDEPFYSGSLSLIEGGHRGASDSVLRALEQVFGLGPGSISVTYKPTHSRRKKAA